LITASPAMLYKGHCAVQVLLLTTLVNNSALNIRQAVQVYLREKVRKAERYELRDQKPDEELMSRIGTPPLSCCKPGLRNCLPQG
jgi:hypothetical protein